MYDTILFSIDGGVAKLTLNRPDRLNSFNEQMHADIARAFDAIDADKSVRGLLLTGAGRGFCAGQDLSDVGVSPADGPVNLGDKVQRLWAPLIRRLVGFAFPTVCAVNGVAAGAGASIAIACDIVLAAKSAKFIQSFAGIGLVPDSGATWHLPRLIGQARALGITMTGQPVTAEQAEQWGLIWRAVDDDKLMIEAEALVAKFAHAPTRGLARTRQLIRGSWTRTLDQSLDAERDGMHELGSSADYAEGIAAFLAKAAAELHGSLTMKPLKLMNYAEGRWIAGSDAAPILSAVTSETVAETGSRGLDFAAMAAHARTRGGAALRALTFHDRAHMLKALATAIMERKEELYELSFSTGATRPDGWIDIEGGAGTLFSYSSMGRRELPNDRILADGPPLTLSKKGTFVGQHVMTPLQGVALHINAFNFPVWGMLEKLGPTLLAGVPAIVKPASATAYVAEAAFRIMIEANVLPPGALQFIAGGVGDLFDHLTCQDAISFTGSASTAEKLQRHPTITRESVRFIAERDSLNASVLGPDAAPGTPEFDLFVKEVAREMTVKAGQKCTAIRRCIVPAAHMDAVGDAISARLSKVVIGDPRAEGATMGALVSQSQREDVKKAVASIAVEAGSIYGDPDRVVVHGADATRGAFLSPILMRCSDPHAATRVHEIEAFGPVSTLMPYRDLADAIALANRGHGSLVMSLFTYDTGVARAVVTGAGAYHGRVLINDRDCAKESTGHGSPLPNLIHGGPGRAGGGEEMGGMRGVAHYMQRTALQGSPRTISAVANRWTTGAPVEADAPHPFRLKFGELEPGKTVITKARTVTLEDIEHFAEFTGDKFYAHMDEEAAKANPFFPGRVAHGYLILSFAAGLFVDPAPGPVLANYGLDNLRFLKPVVPGDSIKVRLTAKSKSQRNNEYGEVKWDVLVTNQNDETVATYDLLTMNAV